MLQSLLAMALALPLAMGADIMVRVGPDGSLLYQPEFVRAKTGDVVKFQFVAKNHTVTQSSFDQPCMFAPGGANTGFIPVPPGTYPLPVKAFTVPHMNPIWFYCAQTPHCQKGMVFAINPGQDHDKNSFMNFKMKAMQQAPPPPMYPPGHPMYTPPMAPPMAPPMPPPMAPPPMPPVYPPGHPSYTPQMAPPMATSSTMMMPPPPIVTPPPPVWVPMTATVTYQSSTYTTTYKSYSGSPPPTPAANPMVHKVIVGENGQLSYNPPMISASIGDTVMFEFRPKNHTVSQSSFLSPCEGLIKADGTPGFKSGFQFVDPSLTSGFPQFSIRVNDTDPIWGYCGQVGHCAAGMVFGINVGTADFTTFQNFAKQIGAAQVAPGTSPTGGLGAPGTDAFGAPLPPSPTGGAARLGSGSKGWVVLGVVLVGVLGWM